MIRLDWRLHHNLKNVDVEIPIGMTNCMRRFWLGQCGSVHVLPLSRSLKHASRWGRAPGAGRTVAGQMDFRMAASSSIGAR